ncbi:MAG: ABC transporter ATP-binding protein [Alphaproteobacteria bacterium]|nr:ABC transporter ATP-binding protein [Alphaproteobacteria bacterium]
MSALLELRGIRKSFGGIRALAGASFAIERPGIYGLIGPNGAGKTTLFDCVAGRQVPDDGEILIAGRGVEGWRPERLAALGLARSFQECRVFPEWTLRDNLLFALRPRGVGAALLRSFTRRAALPAAAGDEAMRLLKLASLERYADAPASLLSFGQRRLLEITAALIGRPQLLLLDEPASGINPGLIAVLADLLRQVHRDQGGVFLIVEHNMEFIMGLADHIVVMHEGAVLAQGPPDVVRADPVVIDAYLG